MAAGPGQFVAVTGGSVGLHPLDKRTWSGLSYSFFSELQRRGRLGDAVGVAVAPAARKWLYMARNFHPDRRRWRKQFYMDVGYRDALTRAARRRIGPDDLGGGGVVQVGAFFNTAEAVDGRAPCFSYSDSSVAESTRSPYAPDNLSAKRIDRAIAYERRVYHAMRTVFTCGRYLRESMIADFGLPPDRVVAIGAGVVLDRVPEPDQAKRYDTREMLILGADFRRKGGFELLRALRVVRTRVPGAMLHVVGPTNLSVPADLAAGVVCHGFLNKDVPGDWERLRGIFARTSLFVLPSLYEPFGVAPLEAMAHEIPCVASNIAALKETVIPGVTGELVEPGNVDDLVDRLSRLLADPDALQRMGRAGRTMVQTQYTWAHVVDRFLNAPGVA